jgi:hypothetical protein
VLLEVRVSNNMVPAWQEERWYVLWNTTTAW